MNLPMTIARLMNNNDDENTDDDLRTPIIVGGILMEVHEEKDIEPNGPTLRSKSSGHSLRYNVS